MPTALALSFAASQMMGEAKLGPVDGARSAGCARIAMKPPNADFSS
jgi:hypothetical protein